MIEGSKGDFMSETKLLPKTYLEQMLANCSEEEVTDEIATILANFLDSIKEEAMMKKLGVVAFMTASMLMLVVFGHKRNKQKPN